MTFFFGETTPAPATTAKVVYKSIADVDFHAFGEENVQILLNRHSGQDKVTTWQLVDTQTEGEGKVWKGEVKGSSWSPFRASRRISADKVTIQNALLDPEVLLKLDDMTESMQVLKSVGEDGEMSLRHMVSKGAFPIAAREFVFITYATTLPDGRLIIASRSIPLEGVQAVNGTVRATNLISGYIIQEAVDANGKLCCDVTLLAHADLSGYIPATVVNMLGTSATVKILANLEAVVKKL